MLHKDATLTQFLVLLIDINWKLAKIECIFATFLAESEIQWIDAKECNEGDGSINVIAKCFNQFGCLGLDDVWLLAVARVQGKTDELLRIVKHLLSFRLSSFYHLEAYVKDQVWQVLQENNFELLILRNAMVQFKKLDNEVRNRLLLHDKLQVRSLPTDDKGLQHHWQQGLNAFDNLMIVLSHFCIASLIFMLDDEVNALKSSSFELINLIVEYLQTSDADDRHIVGRVWNLHTEGESTDENLRKLATCHEPNIALIICLLASETSENAQNHAHERAHYLHFLKDASYSLVLPR